MEELIFQSHRADSSKLDYLKENQAILLVAYRGVQIVGFKLGYVIPGSFTFFSWLGGIIGPFRRRGIAQALLNHQETTAKKMGMVKIYFTTFDRFPAMIQFGKKNGYVLIRSREENNELKYWYEKQLDQDSSDPGRI